jgi:hypothetical protein
MLRAFGLFFMTVVFVIAPLFPANAGSFEGDWVGYWRNSLGETGSDSLWLVESRDGQLHGTWTGDTRVWGQQTGENSMHLNGQRNDGNRSYDIIAHMNNGEMELHYFATRPDGSTYDGSSRLHRQ